MKCAISIEAGHSRTTITAEPGEYDGYPTIREVTVAAAPVSLSPDRATVASVLAFSEFVAGSFEMDGGCSPLVANAVQRWFSPADVHVLNIDFKPAARPDGDGVVQVIADELNGGSWDRPTEVGDVVCRVVPEGTGFLATSRLLAIASNVWLLAESEGMLATRILPAVGVAVMFADDLFATGIAIPGIDPDGEWEALERLRDLLDATGLALVGPGGDPL